MVPNQEGSNAMQGRAGLITSVTQIKALPPPPARRVAQLTWCRLITGRPFFSACASIASEITRRPSPTKSIPNADFTWHCSIGVSDAST